MTRLWLTLIFLIHFGLVKAQTAQSVINQELIKECVQYQLTDSISKLCMFIPFNFFEMQPSESSNVSDELKKFVIIMATERTKIEGNRVSKTEEEIRKSIKLIDSSGIIYLPISEDSASSLIKAIATSFREVLTKSYGAFGDGVHAYIFKLPGNLIMDASKRNRFTITWDSVYFNWQLPFTSLLAPKFCPIDHREMKGDWFYCPIHGVKLQ